MPYAPVEVVSKCLGPLDYWQVIGDLGDVWIVSLFSFLERFPLRLKILDHQVPLDVGSGDASSGGLIVSYYFTRNKELLLGFFKRKRVVLVLLPLVLQFAGGLGSCLPGVVDCLLPVAFFSPSPPNLQQP